MVVRYAVAAGAWSNPATWDGGLTVPDATDDVYANAFTVSIDVDITVNTLRNAALASPLIAVGGAFNTTGTGPRIVTITGTVLNAHLGGVGALFSLNGGTATTINSTTIQGGGTSTNNRAIVCNAGYSGALIVNGNLVGQVGHALHAAGSGAVTINGNITGGSGSSSYGALLVGTGPVTIVGNTVGSVGDGTLASGSGVVTLTGNVTGSGTNSGANGMELNSASSKVIVYGNVLGSAAPGIANGSSSQLTVVGNITGAVNNGINNSGFLRVDGILIWATGGAAPITGGTPPMFMRTAANLGMRAPSDDNWPAATGAPITVQRYAAASSGLPAPADVRAGTTYDAAGTSVGALEVPPPGSVALGVPTDNTVGTAALNHANLVTDILAGTGAQIAAATSG